MSIIPHHLSAETRHSDQEVAKSARQKIYLSFVLISVVGFFQILPTLRESRRSLIGHGEINSEQQQQQQQQQFHLSKGDHIWQERCSHVKEKLGFWSDYQCELWKFIEEDASINMTEYFAENLQPQEKFWASNLHDPPGSGLKGRIIYHLHLHKCMGTTFCTYFRLATLSNPHPNNSYPISLANPDNNCNVPVRWWWNKSQPPLHSQNDIYSAAYMGATRQQMRNMYELIRQNGWKYIANEGSLEEEPIFGEQGPYYYSTILRDPIEWVVSMWHFDEHQYGEKVTLENYLTTKLWGTPDFFTRRICGVTCVHVDTLTKEHFLRAKSMLDHFDLVMVKEMVEDAGATASILKAEFPEFSFPPSHKYNVGKYNQHNLTSFELDYIRNHTVMDKVLYEYAKVLHKLKLESYKFRTS